MQIKEKSLRMKCVSIEATNVLKFNRIFQTDVTL